MSVNNTKSPSKYETTQNQLSCYVESFIKRCNNHISLYYSCGVCVQKLSLFKCIFNKCPRNDDGNKIK